MNWIHALASGWRDRARYLRETGDRVEAKAFDDAADELEAAGLTNTPQDIAALEAIANFDSEEGTIARKAFEWPTGEALPLHDRVNYAAKYVAQFDGCWLGHTDCLHLSSLLSEAAVALLTAADPDAVRDASKPLPASAFCECAEPNIVALVGAPGGTQCTHCGRPIGHRAVDDDRAVTNLRQRNASVQNGEVVA
jgi:hypothetical protein